MTRIALLLLIFCFAVAYLAPGMQNSICPASELAQKKELQMVKGADYEGIIVPSERGAEFMKALDGIEAKSYWTPTQKEIENFEKALRPYLQNAEPGIAKKLKSYRRQYIGLVDNGKRVILGNFFIGQSFSTWRSSPVCVEDGGDNFFRIKYRIDSRSFYDLDINGEA